MTLLIGTLSEMTLIDKTLFLTRLQAYDEALSAKRAQAAASIPAPDPFADDIFSAPAAAPAENGEHDDDIADDIIVDPAPAVPSGPLVLRSELEGSLAALLGYSGLPGDVCADFTRLVNKYTSLKDRLETDPDSRKLRKDITARFHELYKAVLIKSLADPSPPIVADMFLNFGYVDEKLAGVAAANHLFSIARALPSEPGGSVYTLRAWFTAIYTGKVEPSRNEFDIDYAESVRELRRKSKIDAQEEIRMLKDQDAKLLYELDNVFPIVNKLTFGILSTYCPLFADHNVQRRLENSLNTPALLAKIIDEIRAVDFSAFYRETMYSNSAVGITNESVHVEILPNIILMPNIGTRAVLWQEMEGKKRASPARIFMPLFLLTDLKTLVVRVTGEFRWEMCKQVQGMRWNDITNPSLTSELSDFLQFYKNNRDLPPETKEDIRNELIRANNNYKKAFVYYYNDWLLYESNGAPRLNKVVRRMMLTYCAFSLDIREKLLRNPIYADMIKRYNFKQQQRIRHLSNLVQKINKSGKKAPAEILGELEYAKR
jgi:hypothetical protein